MDKQDVAGKLVKLYQDAFDDLIEAMFEDLEDLVDETATNEDKEQTVVLALEDMLQFYKDAS